MASDGRLRARGGVQSNPRKDVTTEETRKRTRRQWQAMCADEPLTHTHASTTHDATTHTHNTTRRERERERRERKKRKRAYDYCAELHDDYKPEY